MLHAHRTQFSFPGELKPSVHAGKSDQSRSDKRWAEITVNFEHHWGTRCKNANAASLLPASQNQSKIIQHNNRLMWVEKPA